MRRLILTLVLLVSLATAPVAAASFQDPGGGGYFWVPMAQNYGYCPTGQWPYYLAYDPNGWYPVWPNQIVCH